MAGADGGASVQSAAMPFLNTSDGLPLGLGGAPLGNLFEAMDDGQAQAMVLAALQSGCRSFDTAPHYGNGLSEHRLGTGLRGVARSGFMLSSKVGRLLLPRQDAPSEQNGYVGVLPFVQQWDYSAAGVRRSVQDSLQRLGLACLDVAYVHDCDRATHGANYPKVLQQVVQHALPELRRMQGEGLIGRVGIGVNEVQVCLDVLQQADLDCLLLAGRYSLIDHSALERLLPLALQRGVSVALGGVFNSGILATGVQEGAVARFNYAPAPAHWVARVAAIEVLCGQWNVPLRAAAVQFPLAHPAIAFVVVGAATAAQWYDTKTMLRHPIAQGFWLDLRRAGLLADGVPTPGAP